MDTIDIHEARTHLSRLVEQAVAGKPFITSRAGKPLVKVTAIDAPVGGKKCRLGFLDGQISAG